jgi:hypothetical protein
MVGYNDGNAGDESKDAACILPLIGRRYFHRLAPVIRASPGKLSHWVGFIAQALIVFASLQKSASKRLFYCHGGILLL